MLSKIRNMNPDAKFAAKIVATRIVLPVAALIVTHVVISKIEKNQEATAE